MKILQSISLPYRAGVVVAILAAVAAAALIISVTLLLQPQRADAQAETPPTLITTSDFPSGDTDTTFTIPAGQTRIISGALDAGPGSDTLVNKGALTIEAGAAIANLNQFTQTDAAATLRIQIADNPGDNPVFELGSADITISGGEIQINYTGSWRPEAFDTFTLFTTKGKIAIPSSVLITDNIGNTDPGYLGTRWGTINDRYNVQVQRYTPDDILTSADFTADMPDTLTIQDGQIRVITASIDLGGAGNKIINEGTLIIKNGVTIDGLAIIDGYIQTAATATLIIDIDIDTALTPNIVTFTGADRDTFRVTRGNVHFNYLGTWVPVILPATSYNPISRFNLFGGEVATLTQSAYGKPRDERASRYTNLRVFIPQEGAVIGGPDATIAPVFTNGADRFILNYRDGPLRIADDLDFKLSVADRIQINYRGDLTIDEGVTIEGIGEGIEVTTGFRGGFILNGSVFDFTINMTRDEASDAPAVRFPGAGFISKSNSPIHVNYGGDWKPSPLGDEFILAEAGSFAIGAGSVTHSQTSTNISISPLVISDSSSILRATITPRDIDDADFGAGDDTFTIAEGEGYAIDGEVDFGAGSDTIENNGSLVVRAGATITGLEAFIQAGTAETLRIEIAEDPGTDPDGNPVPVLDFGDAEVNISAGTIEIDYTGTWRPEAPSEIFTLFASTRTVTVEPSVRIVDLDDDTDEILNTRYTAAVDDDDNTFNVDATGPTIIEVGPAVVNITNDHFTDGDDTIIIVDAGSGTLRAVISGALDTKGGNDTIENRSTLLDFEGSVSIANLETFLQTSSATNMRVITPDPLEGGPVIDFGSADVTITDGSIAIGGGGSASDLSVGSVFTLFTTTGTVNVPSPVVDDPSSLPRYTVTRFGTVPERLNLRLHGYDLADDRLTSTDFIAQELTIDEGETFVIDGELDLGGTGNKIINNGTLVIRSGSSITGLAAVDGYVQSSDTATLAFEIDLDAPPTTDIVTFTTTDADTPATNATFNITGGGARFDYVGDWLPSPVPDQVITLFNNFDIFDDGNDGTGLEFQDSVYGDLSEVTRNDTATEIRVLIPEGAVIGGPNATFAPVIPDPDSGADSIVIEPGGGLRIAEEAEDLSVSGIINRADLTIEEGVTITVTDAVTGGLQQTPDGATLTLELSRDQSQPLAQPVFSLVDGGVQLTKGTLHVEYGGGWKPSSRGDEFTLIDGLNPNFVHTLPAPGDVSHSDRFSDISLRLSADNTAIIATATLSQLESSDFTGGDTTFTIPAGQTRIISGALDAGSGNDTLVNKGALTIEAGAAIANLNQFTQTDATATLRIQIADNPGDNPVFELGSADITISGGEIQINYTGSWRPEAFDTFTLFTTKGKIAIPSSVLITDNIGNTDPGYLGTRWGTINDRYNVQVQRYTPDDILTSADFTADMPDTLTIQDGQIRVITTSIDLGGPGNKIINNGTLIIKNGVTIDGLATIDGYIQTAATATLIIDIDIDTALTPNIVTFTGADRDTFRVTRGNVHFNYLGTWVPVILPETFYNPISRFNLFGGEVATLTQSAYGNPFDQRSSRYTNMRVFIPQEGAVIGGPDATIAPVFTNAADRFILNYRDGPLRIAGDLDFKLSMADRIQLNYRGDLTIDEGVTIEGIVEGVEGITGFSGGFILNGSVFDFTINMTRDEASDAPAVRFPGAGFINKSYSPIHVNYGGDWKPSPLGDEFILAEAGSFDIGAGSVTHSQTSTNISISPLVISDSSSILRATITPRDIDDADFGAGDDTFTIAEGEGYAIDGEVDFGAGSDTIENNGSLVVRAGATITGLEAFIQAGTAETLRIEIAEDPGTDIYGNLVPVLDFGDAEVNISAGTIEIDYTGTWRPEAPSEVFTLFASTRTVTVDPSVRIMELDDDTDGIRNTRYTAAAAGNNTFNVDATGPTIIEVGPAVVNITNDHFTDGDDTIIIVYAGSGTLRAVISGALDTKGGNDTIENRSILLDFEGSVSIANLEAFIQTSSATSMRILAPDPLEGGPVIDFGSADVTITDGFIAIGGGGSASDLSVGDVFTLFTTTGTINVSPSVVVDDRSSLPRYTVTRFGTVPERLNLRLHGYDSDDFLIDDNFTADAADELTIQDGEVRIISGALDLGGEGNKIINNGTLVIRSGSSITGLAASGGYVQSSDTATLAFEIDLDAPPTTDIVTFTTTSATTTATNDTFNITGGGARFDYVGDWLPSPVPDQVITLFNNFDIFNAGTGLEFQDSVYGDLSEVTRNDTATEIRVLIPEGAVIGGDDATFAPVIPDPDSGADSIVIRPGGSLRIAEDLNVSGIINRTELTIEEGVTITVTDEGSLRQVPNDATLTLELSRDKALTQAVFSLVDGQFELTKGTLHVEYGGGWKPSPRGDEFTLIDGLNPNGTHTLLDAITHSNTFSDISLRLSDDNTKIIATTTLSELDSANFDNSNNNITITAAESVTISGTLDAGSGVDRIENEGNILISAGATFTNLETFAQTAADAVLRIEIADDPGNEPVVDFGSTLVTITRGEVQLVYTGTWRPDGGRIFDLYTSTTVNNNPIGDEVQITDNDDDTLGFEYTSIRRGTTSQIAISIQADSAPGEVIDDTAFNANSNTLTAVAGTVSAIETDLDAGDGFDTIANEGTLAVKAGISIDNLELLTQTSTEAVLRIDIAENPGTAAVLTLGSADINISAGEIQIRYTGTWQPDAFDTFTLFATKGVIAIPSSVLITDNIGNTNPGYIGTRYGTVTDRYNVQVQRYTLADIIADTDFTGSANTLTIAVGETRVISGALDLSGTDNKIRNLGTLIIKSGSSITGLAAVDGFTQTATTARLVFDIDLNSPPEADIVTFTTGGDGADATNGTFNITGGNIHFNYLGSWVPTIVPQTDYTLLNGFDLFSDVRLRPRNNNPSSDGIFRLTHSAYGNPTDGHDTSDSSTIIRNIIPQGAVIGGPDATIAPVFNDEVNFLRLFSGGSLHITEDLDFLGGDVDEVSIRNAPVIIEEGVTFEGIFLFHTLGNAFFGNADITFNLTRDEASDAPVITTSGEWLTATPSNTNYRINYNGDWKPAPLGDEFTLVGGLSPVTPGGTNHSLPFPENLFNSQDSTNISLRVAANRRSIIATITPGDIDDADFGAGDDTFTIEEGEGYAIDGTVDFGDGNDTIENNGGLLIRAGATIQNLELLSQTETATLRIEIAEDPGTAAVVTLGDADINITQGTIEIDYTGTWRPQDDQIITLLASTGDVAVASSVQVIGADDAANFRYTGIQTDNAFNVQVDAPAPPLELELDPADDRGISNEDNITNLSDLTFNGGRAITTAITDTMVTVTATLSDGTPQTITATPNADGTYSVELTLTDGVWEIIATQSDGGMVVTSSPAFEVTVDTMVPTFDTQPAWRIATASEFADGDLRIDIEEIVAGVNIDDIFTPAAVADTVDTSPTVAYGKRTSTTAATPSSNCAADYEYNLGATLELSEIEEDGTTVVCASATDTAGNIAYSDPTAVLEIDLLLSGLTYGNGDDTLTIPAGATRTISGAIDFAGGDDTLENKGNLLIRDGATFMGLEGLIQTSASATLRIEIADDPEDDPVLDFGAADVTISGGTIHIYYTGTERAAEGDTFTLFTTTGDVTFTSSVLITDNDTDTDFDFIPTQSGTDPVDLDLEAVQTPDEVIDNSTSTFTTGDDAITISLRPRSVISGAVDALAGDDSITNEGSLRLAAGASITNLETFTQTDANAILRIDIGSNPGNNPVFNFGAADVTISNGQILINYTGTWMPTDGDTIILLSTSGSTFTVSSSIPVTDSDGTTEFGYVATQSGNNYSVLALLPPTIGTTIPDQRTIQGDSVDIDIDAGNFFASEGTLLSYSATVQNGTIATVNVAGNTLTITGTAAGSTGITITARGEAMGTATQTFSLTVLPPTLAAPSLDTGSDTGIAGDSITNDETPTFIGSDALPNASVVITGRNVEPITEEGTYPLGEMVDAMLYPLTEDNIRVTSVSVALGTATAGTGNNDLHIRTEYLFGEDVPIDNVVLGGVEGGNSRLNSPPGRTDVIVLHDTGDGTFTVTATLADGTSQTIRIYTVNTLEASQSPSAMVVGAVTLLDGTAEVTATANSSGDYSGDLPQLSAQGLWEVTAVQIASGLTSITSPITSINLDSIAPGLPPNFDITDRSIAAGGTALVTIAQSFSNEDLTYSAASSNEAVATVASAGGSLTVSAVATGAATITVTATDIAGNPAERTFVVTVFDLVTPTDLDLPDRHDSGAENDDNVTNSRTIFFAAQATPNREVRFTATPATGDAITEIRRSNSSRVEAQFDLSTDGVWTITADEIADGVSSAPSAPLMVTIDRTAPATEGTISDQTATMGESDTVLSNIAQYFDPDDPDRNNFVFAVTSSNTDVATATLDATEGEITIAFVEVGTAEITLTATDTAGNQGSQTFTVNVDPPALSTPDLDGDDDLGASNIDNITSRTDNLTFSGGGAQPGITVAVTASPSSGPDVTGMANAASNGSYTVNLSGLSEGVWEVTVIQIAAGGLESSESDALRITIDTTGPRTRGTVPTPRPLRLGTSPIDGVIGSVAEYFVSTSETFRYGAAIGDRTDGNQTTATLDMSNNNVDVTPGNTAGRVDLQITATDVAGNTTTQTVTVTVILGLPDLASSNDTGSSDSDDATNQTEGLRISGTGAVTGVDVTVRYGRGSEGDTTTVSTQQADNNGRYSYAIDLTQGTWFITAFQELEGTALPDSPTLTVTVDTTPPDITNQIPVGDLHAAVSDGFLNSTEYSESSAETLLAASAWMTEDNTTAVTVTQYVIGRNADDPPVVCDGAYATQDRTLPSLRAPGPTTDLPIGNINYEPDDDFDFGNHYICAIATDIAGNVGYSDPVGPIVRDTTTPIFRTDRPAPGGSGDAIGDNEREAQNIIDVGNTHANDLIAFAVQPSSANATCGPDFGAILTTAIQAAQFDASNLIDLAEGSYDVCIRLTDEAGNAPNGVFASTSITRNFTVPSVTANIPDQTLSTGEPLTFRGVSGGYFEDTANDTLRITAESSNPNVVRVTPGSGDSFTLEAVAVVPEGADPVIVTVTATDTAGQTARQRFTVTVTSEFDLEFPEPPSGSSIDYFVVVEMPEDAPDRPTPPRGVRFPVAVYDITPRDTAGAALEDVTAEVCLPIEGLVRLGNLAVYHFADRGWERLPSYISDDGTHICAETESFSIFALGFIVDRTTTTGLLPPTGGIIPSIWIVVAAATAGLMTLLAGTALALTAMSRRLRLRACGGRGFPVHKTQSRH